jgi:hypothetical protein
LETVRKADVTSANVVQKLSREFSEAHRLMVETATDTL